MGVARPSKCCALVPSMKMTCTLEISQLKVLSACPKGRGMVIHESGMRTRNLSTNTHQFCPVSRGIHEIHDLTCTQIQPLIQHQGSLWLSQMT